MRMKSPGPATHSAPARCRTSQRPSGEKPSGRPAKRARTVPERSTTTAKGRFTWSSLIGGALVSQPRLDQTALMAGSVKRTRPSRPETTVLPWDPHATSVPSGEGRAIPVHVGSARATARRVSTTYVPGGLYDVTCRRAPSAENVSAPPLPRVRATSVAAHAAQLRSVGAREVDAVGARAAAPECDLIADGSDREAVVAGQAARDVAGRPRESERVDLPRVELRAVAREHDRALGRARPVHGAVACHEQRCEQRAEHPQRAHPPH